MIDHEPSGRTSTSFETTSIALASASPMRFESTARMLGSIPLERPWRGRTGGVSAGKGSGAEERACLEMMTTGMSRALQYAWNSLKPASRTMSAAGWRRAHRA